MFIRTNTFVKLFVISSFLFIFANPSFSQEPPSPGASVSHQAININTADAESIAKRLKGIGLKKAQAIVNYRETYGAFAKIEELTAVKGIGPSIIQSNHSVITIN